MLLLLLLLGWRVVLLSHGWLEEGCWARNGAQAAEGVHCGEGARAALATMEEPRAIGDGSRGVRCNAMRVDEVTMQPDQRPERPPVARRQKIGASPPASARRKVPAACGLATKTLHD